MFGIILIYFIGKYFYKLAEKYNRSKWGFAVIGVVVYYAGILISGIIIAFALDTFGFMAIDDINDVALGLAGLPFGLLACWGLYKILERNWSNKNNNPYDIDILDAGMVGKDF